MRHPLLPMLLLIPLVLMVVVALTPVDPWHDEAMLIANLVAPDLNILSPLPYYEQAAPVGYLGLAKAVLATVGIQPPYSALRLFSAAFVAAGIVLVLGLRSMRADPVAATILAACLLGSPLIWVYAGEIKHYSADFFAAALVLGFGLPLARTDRPAALAIFLLAVLVAGLLSFTAPITVLGLVLGVGLYRFLAGHTSPGAAPLSLRFVATGTIAVAWLAMLYLTLNRDLVVYQMAAYSYVYDPAPGDGLAHVLQSRMFSLFDVAAYVLGTPWLEALRNGLVTVGLPVGMSFHLIRLFLIALIVAATLLAYRRAPLLVFVFFGTMAVTVVLVMLGLVRLAYARHVFFLLPLSLAILSLAMAELVERLLPARWRLPTAQTVLIGALIFGVTSGLGRETQEISKLLAHIGQTHPDTPVWVFGGAQPAVHVLTPRPPRILGEFDKTSRQTAWQIRGGEMLGAPPGGGDWRSNPAYPKTIGPVAAGEKKLWLLFAQFGPVPEHSAYLETASAVIGPCRLAMKGNASALYFCEAPISASGMR